ncbi:proton-conducting transporter transmembrane domain-containing protein [Halosegnis longus]|uniref:proton-conducting transporter transmembrane domain-containing protein n=1 Tax=Halosegnis longus TaxID=2216012 RepID=UPI00129D96D1|nr:proton-conducting transporter membrane subunit [Halosegnis longus]
MSGHSSKPTVGALPDTTVESPFVPVVLTWLVWSLFVATVVVLVARLRLGAVWELPGLVAIDGLTVLMWVVITFFSSILHSYSRRYMAGSSHQTRFFLAMFGFTVAVMALLAADHIALFGVLWMAMGLIMAKLIGINEGWKQAQAAAAVARNYFLTSSILLGGSLTALWWATDATTISGISAAADTLGGSLWLVAAGGLVFAAMIQSALIPFHGWLLSSMTAPTPASALMHAGFVNAGGILLTRFAPVITVDSTLMLGVVAVGAASAGGGKLLKSVQTDIKTKLGCSTVGQMGFMIMQAGLGFFGAAITHLILHGFYKAYQFLSSGQQVEQKRPSETTEHTVGRMTSAVGFGVALLTGLVGGVVFTVLTGKGANVDSGLLLTFFVVFTTLHAARTAVQHTSLSPLARYGAVPLVFFPAIVTYAVVYESVSNLLTVSTATTELTLLHGVIAVAFVGIYVAIETGIHEHSQRLYVALLNATQPSSDTLLTSTEEYNEY